jgi:lipoprotein-anchoring transpeptidase ErfK/SrfK
LYIKLKQQKVKKKAEKPSTDTLHKDLVKLGFTHKVLRHVLFASSGALAFVAVFTAFFYFVAHGSLNHIYIGTIPVKATDSRAQIEQKISNTASSYQITLQYPDGSKKSYPLSKLGLSIDPKVSASLAKQTINESVPERLRWWEPMYIQLDPKINREQLKNFINSETNNVSLAPKDAALATDSGAVVLTPEQPGKGSRIDHAYGAIYNAVSTLQPNPLVFKPAVLQPSITETDLKPSQDKVNNLLAQKVEFNVAGHEITASKSDIAGWIELSPVNKEKTVDVTVDSGKVLQYINKIARPYIQPPRARLITNTDGGQVVLDAGANGVDVVSKDQTAANVAKSLLNNKGVKTDLSIKYASSQTVEVQPYAKWFVADVTTKRMYAYENTTLVKTFLISAGAPRTPTVIGKYAIYSKYRSQDMSGNNADGSRYFQPAVPYVNYFYGGYAIHGNYWRPESWFGNINSSHGCIGVNVSDGSWIYSWAPTGTPVIVHS